MSSKNRVAKNIKKGYSKFMNKFLYLLLVVALLLSLANAKRRVLLEREYKDVELALSFEELSWLAAKEKIDLEELLLRFKAKGVTSIVFENIGQEEFINSLSLSPILHLKTSPIGEILKISRPSGVIFGQEEILDPKRAASYLREKGIKYYQVEFSQQKGAKELAARVPSLFVRAHSIKRKEVEESSPEQVTLRFLRAARERNMRLLYLKLFLFRPIEDNLKFVEGVVEGLKEEGFRLGSNNILKEFSVHPLSIFFIGLGIISAGLILVREVTGIKGHLLFLIISASLLATFLNKLLLQQILAFMAAIIFPLLGMNHYFHLRGGGNPYLKSLKAVLLVTLAAILGSLLVTGLLSESRFLLKIEDFRGVKFSFGLTLLLSALLLLKRLNLSLKSFKSLYPLFLALIFLLLLVRSGNFGFVFPYEAKTRELLESLLFARPRFKEFVLGLPCLLFGAYLLYEGKAPKKIIYPLLLLGVLAPISQINTFCHLHTPLLFSLLRSLNGLWLGLLLGTVLILIWCGYRVRR